MCGGKSGAEAARKKAGLAPAGRGFPRWFCPHEPRRVQLLHQPRRRHLATILAMLGYSLGHNEAAIRDNLKLITLITLGAVAVTVIILLYVRIKLKKKIIR